MGGAAGGPLAAAVSNGAGRVVARIAGEADEALLKVGASRG